MSARELEAPCARAEETAGPCVDAGACPLEKWRMRPRSLLLAAALVGVALPACKREPEAAPVVAKHRAAVEARLATLAKIGAALKSVAPLKADKVALDAGPLVLGRTLSVASSDNAVMQTDKQLADVGASADFDLGTLGQAARCKEAMKPDSIERWSASVAEEALALCTRAKYVVVLRTVEHKRPEVVGDKFDEGKVVAEVHVFNWDAAKHLGGFRVTAVNSDTVTSYDKEGTSALLRDLEAQLEKAILAGLGKHAR